MELTQEQIISEYKKLKLKLGRVPNAREFYSETKVTDYSARVAFGGNAYSKIQSEAGDEPRKFCTNGRKEYEFFEIYGRVVRELNRIPTVADWMHRKEKPTLSGYRHKLKINWKQMPLAFIDWAINKSDWEDVVDICTSYCKERKLYSENTEVLTTSYGYVYLIKANRKGQYKIGKTGSPAGRKSQLSQLDPHDRRYEHVLETNDPCGLENYWHRRFEDKKVSGEIFKLSKKDLKAFKEFYVKEAPKTY